MKRNIALEFKEYYVYFVHHDLAWPVKLDSSFWTICDTKFQCSCRHRFLVSFASIICTFLFPPDLISINELLNVRKYHPIEIQLLIG